MSATVESTPNATKNGGRLSTDDVQARAARETARVLQAELSARIDGEVRFDRSARMLYSTDASNYQIEPIGVVIPKTIDDAQAARILDRCGGRLKLALVVALAGVEPEAARSLLDANGGGVREAVAAGLSGDTP